MQQYPLDQSEGLELSRSRIDMQILNGISYQRSAVAPYPLLQIEGSCEGLLGYDAATLMRNPIHLESEHASSELRLQQAIQQSLDVHSSYCIEYPLQHQNGSTIWVRDHGRVLERPHAHISGILLDITEEIFQQRNHQDEQNKQSFRLKVFDQELHLALKEKQQNQAHLEAGRQRRQQQQSFLCELAHLIHDYSPNNKHPLRKMCQGLADIFRVERFGIWIFDGQELIDSNHLIDHQHHCAKQLSPEHYPELFARLQERPLLKMAKHEFSLLDCPPYQRYLSDNHIQNLLLAHTQTDSKLSGLLCAECKDPERVWDESDEQFIAELALIFSNSLFNAQKRTMRAKLGRFKQAVNQCSSAIFMLNPELQLTYSNQAFYELTGFSAEQALGTSILKMVIVEPESLLKDALVSLSAESSQWQGEIRCKNKQGAYYWGQLNASRVCNEKGEVDEYIGLLHDKSAQRSDEETIKQLSFYDPLTELENRQLFQEKLHSAICQAVRSEQDIALLTLDLDNFKVINDSLGHQVGDQLLTQVGTRIKLCIRNSDSLARIGGDEFGILLNNFKQQQDCAKVAEHILKTLSQPFYIDAHQISISASMGISIAPLDADNMSNMLKHSELAMYQAKDHGKNNYQFFTASMHHEIQQRLLIENELRQAVIDDQLELYYQAKVSLEDQQLHSFEALLRWQHPEHGMISPETFIPIAEATGLIIPIGNWIIHQCCASIKQLSELSGRKIQIALNLSARQFRDPELINTIDAALRENDLEPGQLECEITESMLMDHVEEAISKMHELKALGVRLSIDDFGTGYSSLSYLKRFPIDKIKVDRSFVIDIPENEDDLEICAAVIAMAHRLNLEVVAEGIETQEQLEFLQKQQCRYGQGYLFSRPLPIKDVLEHPLFTLPLQNNA